MAKKPPSAIASSDKLLKQILSELKASKAEISKLTKANAKTERQVHRLKNKLDKVKFCNCSKKKTKSSRKTKNEETAKVNIIGSEQPTLKNILASPLGGKADDLKWIAGVGPKLEETLNDLGIYHFEQISNWSKDEIDWVDNYLKFSGRIERDNWIEQAKALAKGGWDEYVKVFGKEPR